MMKLKNSLLVFFLFLPGIVKSQSFNKTYLAGRPHFSYDVSVQSMAVLKEGMILANTILEENNINSDVLITRIDDKGNVVWSQRYGKAGRNEEVSGIDLFPGGAHVMVVGNSNEGTFVAGTGVVINDLDVLLLKVKSSDGTLVWSKRFGQERSVDQAWVVKSSQRSFLNPRFIILGSAGDYNSDDPVERPLALRVDGNGNLDWSRRYPEVSVFDNTFDRPTQAIFQGNEELLIVGNYNDQFETGGLYTMGISTVDGHITADYKQFGVQSAISIFGSIVKDDDGYLVAYGSLDTHSASAFIPQTDSYITVTKMDSSRNLVWTRRYWKPGIPLQSGVSIHKSAGKADSYDILARMLNANDAFPVLMSISGDGKVKSARKFEFENQAVYENYATNMVPFGKGYFLQAMSSIRGYLPRGFSIARTDLISRYQCTAAIDLSDTLAIANAGIRARLEVDFGQINERNMDVASINTTVLNCTPGTFPFEEAQLSVYPNPVSGEQAQTRLEFTADQAGIVRLDIRNNDGKVLLSERYTVVEGKNQLEVPTSALMHGINIATLTDAQGKKYVVRIFKE
jgi:hypothetical protein